MLFLIDYENVRNAGMRGAKYLQPSDYVIVFYSGSAQVMETRYLTAIRNSGCMFETCRLVKTRKNGLDFYIATRLGELFGAGFDGNAVIVSGDEGFQSLREYWQSRSKPPRRVLVNESIERGIISANENDERTAAIREQLKSQDIGNFFAAYQESRKLRELLENAFSNTAFSSRTAEMADILRGDKTSRRIYLDTIQRFGRQDGLEIYHILKSCMENI